MNDDTNVGSWPFASFRVREQSGRFQIKADIKWRAVPVGSVENDPQPMSVATEKYRFDGP
jgi:hypothetical protein